MFSKMYEDNQLAMCFKVDFENISSAHHFRHPYLSLTHKHFSLQFFHSLLFYLRPPC